MDDKPFLTVDEQMALLRRRGLHTDSETERILMREGYYSIINGYKTPFIDRAATASAGDDRYVDGTTFSNIYDLFRFDRELRNLTFGYLIKAEACTRAAISYCFSEKHRGHAAYKDVSNYAAESEYLSRKSSNRREYTEEMHKLMLAFDAAENKRDAPFVKHYKKNHTHIPLWVLSNNMTFGNLEHMFNLMTDSDRSSVCKMVAVSNSLLGDRHLGFFSPKKASISLEILVRFRNICAHDERFYCAKVGARKNVGYIEMISHLERFLPPLELIRLIKDINSLYSRYKLECPGFTSLFVEVGFPKLIDKIADLERHYLTGGQQGRA